MMMVPEPFSSIHKRKKGPGQQITEKTVRRVTKTIEFFAFIHELQCTYIYVRMKPL